jgi:DnaK suppressor protein
MPAKKAAAKKSKKTGSTKKAAGKTSRKKSARRSTVASRSKVTKRSTKKTGRSAKKTGKVAGTSSKKGTSKKVSKKVAAKKKVAAPKKPASKKKSPVSKKVSKKKVVAKSASSKKKTPSKPASSRNSAAQAAAEPSSRVPSNAAAAAAKSTRASALSGPVRGFQPYQPKRGEAYMSDEQLEHFRHILMAWKRELMEEVDRTVLHMKDDAANFPDPNDRATQESEFGLELRTRDRERKLLKKIDSALQRIDDRSYGYCEETGDEIGLRRLEARPVATLCVEAQERRELAERQFRDREDYYR